MVLSLATAGCTATGTGGGSDGLEPLGAVPDAAALETAAASLPETPEDAARALVQTLRGADRDQAVAATAEILRRAGFPIVTADGHIVALPDGWTAFNHTVYVELIPALTAQVRADSGYAASDVADYLTALGISGDAVDEGTIVGVFAHWGKSVGDVAETRFAGAVARESGWQRGELFAPDAPAPRVDPLQFVLLSGHATAFTVPASVGEPSGGKGMVRHGRTGLVGDTCQALTTQSDKDLSEALDDPAVKTSIEKMLGYSPDSAELGQQVNDVLRGYGRDTLRDGVKQGVHAFGTAVGKGAARHAAAVAVASWDRATFTYDVATDALSSALLLLGARISISSTGDRIHFWHDDNPSLKFTATATFSSPLVAARFSCASLLGITVPPDGPLKGFKIRWSMEQDTMPGNSTPGSSFLEGKYLAPLKGQGSKLQEGETTGADGTSTLLTIPRQESNPGVGTLHEGTAIVSAKLDKEDFPFKLKDLMSLANPAGISGAAIGKVLELAQQLLTKLGLPTAHKAITVEYHAPDVYVIEGDGRLSFLWTGIEYFTTTAYSCDGLSGPWHGDASFTAKIGPATEMAAGLLEVPITQRELNLRSDAVSFTLEPRTGEQQIALGMENIGLSITLTQLPGDDAHLDGVIGTGTWTIDGAAADKLLAYKPIAMFSSGLRYPVVGVDQIPECPGGLDEDTFFIH